MHGHASCIRQPNNVCVCVCARAQSAVEAVVREGEGTLHKLTEIAAVTRSFHKGVSLLCAWLEKLCLRLINDTGTLLQSSDFPPRPPTSSS